MRAESRAGALRRARRAPQNALTAIYNDVFRRALPRDFLAKLPNMRTVTEVVQAYPSFGPFDTHWTAVRNRLEANYEKVILAVAAQETKARGFVVKTDQPNQRPGSMAEFLERVSGQRIQEISESERERIVFLVEGSLNATGTIRKETIQRIRQTAGLTKKQLELIDSLDITETAKKARIRKAKTQRATTIARTEANAARNQGLLKSWSDAQIPAAQKEWVSFPDERQSEICDELNGQIVPVESLFTSSEGDFYAPPAHPNCRSTMRLVEV